jgi:DNA-directed RNA polymerase sigma subunit (sigma70/sigma32)
MKPVLVPTRTRTARAKPIAVSTTLHSPARRAAGGQLHGPANGLALVKTNASAQHAARMARRDRLVLEHLPLVKAIAVRVRENLPVHVDLDDLVHAGVLGLVDAANKLNPKKQAVFSSYAKHRVKAAMLDSLRQVYWGFPRHAPCGTSKCKPPRATSR